MFFSFACLCYVGNVFRLWAAWVIVFNLAGISVAHGLVVATVRWLICFALFFSVFCFGAHTEPNMCVLLLFVVCCCRFTALRSFCSPDESRAQQQYQSGEKHTCRNIDDTFVHFIFAYLFINEMNYFRKRHTSVAKPIFTWNILRWQGPS